MSSTTGPRVTDERAHTSRRTVANASCTSAAISGVMSRNVRYIVESDATDPNKRSSTRRCSMSAQLLPPASITIVWVKRHPEYIDTRWLSGWPRRREGEGIDAFGGMHAVVVEQEGADELAQI
jgi:hypothetical protein